MGGVHSTGEGNFGLRPRRGNIQEFRTSGHKISFQTEDRNLLLLECEHPESYPLQPISPLPLAYMEG
jgi:hypothetical protein